MDSGNHAVLGALITGIGYLGYKWSKNESPTIIETILAFAGGAIAGAAPDILESPTNPNHRSIFHSKAMLDLISKANQNMWQSKQLTENQKAIISLLSASYASHLVVDGTTPKGLPLII